MSHDILLQLGAAAFATSAAIMVVLLARKGIARTFGPHVAYAFWLMVPVAAFAGLLPAEQVFQVAPTFVQEVAPAAPGSPAIAPIPGVKVVATGESSVAKAAIIDPMLALTVIWLAGGLLAAARLIYRQRKFMGDSALTRVGTRFYKASKNTVGPAAVGILKTRVVVPRDFTERYSAVERKLIVDHEREHIRYGDVRTNAFAAVFQCLNWFNPLVYLAQKALREDQELACDARVMKKYADHKGHKRAYAEALLKAQFAGQSIPVGCAWPAGGGETLKHRIANLGQQPSSVVRNLSGAVACLLAVAVTGQAVRAMIPTETVYVQKDVDASITAKVKRLATVTDDGDPEAVAGALGAALIDALADGRRSHARSLIKAGADINYFKRGDGTPLIIAADQGDRKTVRMLLEAGADASKPAPGDGSPLIAAADRGDKNMVKLLIDSGADVNGYVPGDGTPLIAAIEDGDTQVVRMLLDAGAEANKGAPGDGSPLIAASGKGELKLAQVLLDHGADVNGYVPGDETPLINAAAENEIELARFLIEKGADVNLAVEATDRRGRSITRSPLGQAERFGNDRMAKLLRDKGAKSVGKEN